MMEPKNFTLKVFEKGRLVGVVRTHKKRSFLEEIRTINWKKRKIKVYLRIYYGKYKSVWGEEEEFYNEGSYTHKKDFQLALKAFLDV